MTFVNVVCITSGFWLSTAQYFGSSDGTFVCSKGHWLKNTISLGMVIVGIDRPWIYTHADIFF